MASDSIKSNEWKFFNGSTTQAEVSIESLNFTELLIQVDANNSGNKEIFYVPKRILSGTNNYFRMGGYRNANSNALVTIRCSLSEVALMECFVNGQDFSSTSTTQVYYR